MFSFAFGRFSHRFAISNLRFGQYRVRAEFRFQLLADYRKMRVADAYKKHFARVGIFFDLKRRVFFHKSAKPRKNLVFVALFSRADRHRVFRRRHFHRGKDYFFAVIQNVARLYVVELGKRADIARRHLVRRHLFFAHYVIKRADFLRRARSRIGERIAGFNRSAKHSENIHFAHERIYNGFKHAHERFSVRIGFYLDVFAVDFAYERNSVLRTYERGNHFIHKVEYTLIFERASA